VDRVTEPKEAPVADDAGAPTDRAVAAAPSACLNCGAPLDDRFCGRCGQEADVLSRPLREILADAADQLGQLDVRLLRTLPLLALPGRLSEAYLAGRRVPFVSPVRLFFLSAAAFFLTVVLFVGRDVPQIGAETTLFEDLTSLAVRDSGALTVALVFLAPLFALLLARSFRGEGRFYVDHLVVSLHAHSVLFVLGVVAVLASAALRVDVAGGAGVAALGVWILHLIAALRRVYGRPWPTTFLRTLSVLGVYLLILLVVLGIAAGLIVAAREAAG
jgi:hypothetical protein